MEIYSLVSSEISRLITGRYSGSFAAASRLYDAAIRPHILNIHAWAELADEIVSSGTAKKAELLAYKRDTYQAIRSGFSANPVIHSFAQTARAYRIGRPLIEPVFASKLLDISPPKRFTKSLFKSYLKGSAGALGLMCLRVAVGGDRSAYNELREGTEALVTAFAKVDHLRDFATDTTRLGRSYFAEVHGTKLTESAKQRIINDIRHDFTHALPALHEMPKNSHAAITVTARYYYLLLEKLAETPAAVINIRRIRLPDWRKAQIFAGVAANHTLKRTI